MAREGPKEGSVCPEWSQVEGDGWKRARLSRVLRKWAAVYLTGHRRGGSSTGIQPRAGSDVERQGIQKPGLGSEKGT